LETDSESASSAHYCFQNIIRTLASLIGTNIKWPNAANIENIAYVSNMIIDIVF